MRGQIINRLSVVLVVVLMVAAFVAAPTSASPVEQTCGPSTTYVIQRGDTLFRIALRFGTTYPALAAANGITNPNRIFYGTTIRVPCANTVPLPPIVPVIPPVNPPSGIPGGVPVYQPPVIIDCTKLRATSPRDGLAYGDNTFYWDPLPGATSY